MRERGSPQAPLIKAIGSNQARSAYPRIRVSWYVVAVYVILQREALGIVRDPTILLRIFGTVLTGMLVIRITSWTELHLNVDRSGLAERQLALGGDHLQEASRPGKAGCRL